MGGWDQEIVKRQACLSGPRLLAKIVGLSKAGSFVYSRNNIQFKCSEQVRLKYAQF